MCMCCVCSLCVCMWCGVEEAQEDVGARTDHEREEQAKEFEPHPGGNGEPLKSLEQYRAWSDVRAEAIPLGAVGSMDWRRPGQRQWPRSEAMITAEIRPAEELTQSSGGEAEREPEL